MTHDVTKLPKWAQSEINRLERDLEAAREQNRLQVEGETEVFIHDYPDNHPLPPNTTISFELDGERIDVDVREHHSGQKALYLYVYGGTGSLGFASGASNTGWAFVWDR